MKQRLIKLMALLLCVAIPLSAFVLWVDLTDDPYAKTYLGAFEEKYARLYGSEQKKIIFIGGSSLPFGLRSDLIEQELGGEYEVINFGLYATLGTKFMMDMAKDAISEGDIVILAPELNTQTYSLYFNPEAVLQATGDRLTMNFRLPIEDQLSVTYSYFRYGFERIGFSLKDNAPDPIGVYRADSLNEWGDIAVELPNNIMNNGYDSNLEIYLDERLFDEEFFDYVNDYVADVEKKGAKIYFNYSPANVLSLKTSKAQRAEFEQALSERLDCPLLGTIEDYVIDERYFYDTNFHLNSDGAVYFSDLLVRSLKGVLGREEKSSLEIPSPPPLESDLVVEVTDTGVAPEDYLGEPNADFVDVFEYEQAGDSYKIVGVKDEYLGITEVILPSIYDGKNVTAVEKGAFDGCAMLEYIHVGQTYKSLSAGAFSGCVSLKGVYLYKTDGNQIAPPADGLLDGAPSGVILYIPEGSNYTSGYTWANYIDRFVTFNKGGAE
ncbi:MAG: hypothetical protein J6Q82_03095 [Clostridia bacterium]|nr:hypothetical protein [Clostridia bacterium]